MDACQADIEDEAVGAGLSVVIGGALLSLAHMSAVESADATTWPGRLAWGGMFVGSALTGSRALQLAGEEVGEVLTQRHTFKRLSAQLEAGD